MSWEEYDEYDEEYEDEQDIPDELDVDELSIEVPEPHPGQHKVLASKAKWRVLCCGRRWGKSHICLQLAIESMLEGGAVAYVTPEFSLGREFYNQILNYIPDELIRFTSKADLSIKLRNGGELKFFSGEATRSIRGRKFHRVIIDEAAFIPDLEDIWMNVIMPTLATTNGDALFVSTPNGMNYFYAIFQKGKYGEAYLKEIADVCGINKTLTTHAGRRTFVSTVMLNNGVRIGAVSRMLAHSSIRITQQYAKVYDHHLLDQTKHIDWLWRNKP